MLKSRTYIAIPPGMTIKEMLVERGMNQKEFAARMDLSEKHVSRLINGDVQLTQDVAYRLESVLGVPAFFWNNLESTYRETLIKVDAENEMENDEAIARLLPYSEMASFGWVQKTNKIKEKVLFLRQFWEVSKLTLLDNAMITRIACRRLAITEKSDLALMAWAQKVKRDARQIKASPINIERLIAQLPGIRQMTMWSPDEFSKKLQELLVDCGIALVFVPHLKGSFLHGATFVDGRKIVLGLTVRGNDGDRFWFSLFHEFAHIILGHIGQLNGVSKEDEEAADRWAADQLIAPSKYKAFVEKRRFSRESITEFAKTIDIATGIVVGRLQKDNFVRYDAFNDLKTRYTINEQ
ncbi:MAG: helix-turn-helix domain-containing protein [Bacteroidales bacterium]|jgi:HTH-type transcriptional regulator/antitoxin HigA|nr:helix-turn-helix domain-containing protein [Bacteroidales bacterium]